jgi:hypothetical protein
VAVVGPVDQLVNEELDLVGRDGCFVLAQVLLEIVLHILEDEV